VLNSTIVSVEYNITLLFVYFVRKHFMTVAHFAQKMT